MKEITKLKKELEKFIKMPSVVKIETKSMFTVNRGMTKNDMFKGFARIVDSYTSVEQHFLSVYFDHKGFAEIEVRCKALSSTRLPVEEVREMLLVKERKYIKDGYKPLGVVFSHSNKMLVKNEDELRKERAKIKVLVKQYNLLLQKKKS